jgi:Recombinase zinc beta ribbon domain
LTWNSGFYIGLIRLKRTGETFPGNHAPLIPKSLFDRVQKILTGKTNTRVQKHDFLFRRLLSCKHCGYAVIGERQKSHHYYRCHTTACPMTGIREEIIEKAIQNGLIPLTFSEDEREYFQTRVALEFAGTHWRIESANSPNVLAPWQTVKSVVLSDQVETVVMDIAGGELPDPAAQRSRFYRLQSEYARPNKRGSEQPARHL